MIGTDYKYSIRCGYCNEEGHNVTTCKEVERYYESYKNTISQGKVPLSHERRAAYEMKRRKERKAKRQGPKSTPRCSFCRCTGHRRPKCEHLKKLREDAYKANEVWRKYFVQLINDTGIGIGAYIKIPSRVISWQAPENGWTPCLVTGYDYDTLNLFNTYTGRDNFNTSARMHISTIDKLESFNWNFNKVKEFVSSGLVTSFWGEAPTVVVSGAQWEPPAGWYTDKCPEIEYVLSKVSENSKNYKNIHQTITKWRSL